MNMDNDFDFQLEQLEKVKILLGLSFDELKVLRDYVDTDEKEIINQTIDLYTPIRTNLWKIDKLLEIKKNQS